MKRIVFLLLLILVIVGVYKLNAQSVIIPSSSIRLRVIPNSNNPLDINLKEQVKSYLENDIYQKLKDIDDIETARTVISNSVPEIESGIANIFKENEYPLNYKVNFGYNYFPEKTYHRVKYHEGYYESLVIEIGEAQGDNWWCALFPDFCLVDTKNKKEPKLYIKELISKYSKNK